MFRTIILTLTLWVTLIAAICCLLTGGDVGDDIILRLMHLATISLIGLLGHWGLKASLPKK